jgi:hypothetical protein
MRGVCRAVTDLDRDFLEIFSVIVTNEMIEPNVKLLAHRYVNKKVCRICYATINTKGGALQLAKRHEKKDMMARKLCQGDSGSDSAAVLRSTPHTRFEKVLRQWAKSARLKDKLRTARQLTAVQKDSFTAK